MSKNYEASLFKTSSHSLALLDSILQSIIEYSIVVYHGDGQVLLWNDGAKFIYGYDSNEVINKMNITSFFTEEDLKNDCPAKMFSAALKKGKWEGSIRQVQKNGEKFWSYGVITPYSKNEINDSFLAIFKDISKELRLEKLEKKQYYTRSLIEASDAAMLVIDAAGIIVDVNEEALKITEYSREELIGSEFSKYFSDEEKAIQAINSIYRDGRLSDYEMLLRTKKGEMLTTLYFGRRLYDKEGNLVGVIGAIRDITQQKLIEDVLHADYRNLKDQYAAKGDFLATMSHELRTPLNAIIGFTGTLLMELPGPINSEQKEQLNIVKKNSEHLLSLIEDILDLEQIESGKSSIKVELFNCQEVTQELIDSFRPTAELKGLKLEYSKEKGPSRLNTDKRVFKQILINLINNAIKYTNTGTVRVVLEEEKTKQGNTAVFHVYDTGIGIKEEDQNRIFQPFEQIHETNKLSTGTGLGLSLSKKLAESINSTIHFESKYGTGSHFSLSIPLEEAVIS